MHARSGGNIEVMGLMQGKIDGNTMIIMDAFALPVEGTETRVNAQSEANEYMVQYLTTIRQVYYNLTWNEFIMCVFIFELLNPIGGKIRKCGRMVS